MLLPPSEFFKIIFLIVFIRLDQVQKYAGNDTEDGEQSN